MEHIESGLVFAGITACALVVTVGLGWLVGYVEDRWGSTGVAVVVTVLVLVGMFMAGVASSYF